MTGIAGQLVGSVATVRDAAADLLDRTGADELMAVTTTHDPADRLRSYELLADAVRPTPAAPAPAAFATNGTFGQ